MPLGKQNLPAARMPPRIARSRKGAKQRRSGSNSVYITCRSDLRCHRRTHDGRRPCRPASASALGDAAAARRWRRRRLPLHGPRVEDRQRTNPDLRPRGGQCRLERDRADPGDPSMARAGQAAVAATRHASELLPVRLRWERAEGELRSGWAATRACACDGMRVRTQLRSSHGSSAGC